MSGKNAGVLKIGVIGYGYWGPNLVRNFNEAAQSEVLAVSDFSQKRLDVAKIRYPALEVYTDHKRLLADSAIDAVAIATPVSTHFDLAMEALKSGKHVFLEKPFTEKSEQAVRLLEEADRQNLVIVVDHTFVYTGAVQKISKLVNSGELGDLYYYDSVRVNLGLFQHDVSVIWDLAVHDLSILNSIYPHEPVAVSATGINHVIGRPENIAFLTLFYSNTMIAHIHVNWLAPVKIRRTLLGGNKKMIVYDDLEPSEKVKVYNKGITIDNDRESVYQDMIGYRTGDMWAPKLENKEALMEEVEHFIRCITDNETPRTGGGAGLIVVKTLEAATRSMAERGRPVELSTLGTGL